MKMTYTYKLCKRLPEWVVLLVVLFVFMSPELASQYSYHKYLSVEKEKQPKTFVELLFKMNEPAAKKVKPVKKSSKKQKSGKVNNDTSQVKNRIESIRDGGDIFYLYLELADHESTIKITVYNMLGKKVRDVYEGIPYPNGVPYEISIVGPPSLPNGVYLCVVVGKNFRLRDKFVVARG